MYGMYGPMPPWQTPYYGAPPANNPAEAIAIYRKAIKDIKKSMTPDDKKKDQGKKPDPVFTFLNHLAFWLAILPILGAAQFWAIGMIFVNVIERLHPIISPAIK